jgi:hypothetical protein
MFSSCADGDCVVESCPRRGDAEERLQSGAAAAAAAAGCGDDVDVGAGSRGYNVQENHSHLQLICIRID